LDCSGDLSWVDVEPGATVTGEFEVLNVGDAGSLLDWEVTEWPEWGTWSFDPMSGTGLTPAGSPVTVSVEVVAPDEQNTEFEGEVKVVNVDDPDDFCVLEVSLATPVSQDQASAISLESNSHTVSRVISQTKHIKPTAQTNFGTILMENMDGTWVADPDGDPYFVPSGWDIDGICTSYQSGYPLLTHYWSQMDSTHHPMPYSAPYAAAVWWSDGTGGDPTSGAQDEWLITPELDCSNYYNLILEFYSCYTMPSYGAAATAHDYIKASTDGGSTWNIVADLAHDPEYEYAGAGQGYAGAGWNWNEVMVAVDLTAYDYSSSLILAFNYDSDGASPRGIWAVDDVMVSGEEGSPAEPDLECDGDLSWADVEPGSTVTGDFVLRNHGDDGSELNWEITEWPDWGTWTFTPASGTGLTPAMGWQTIDVELVAPDEQNTDYEGEVKVENSDDPDDFCIIQVALSTPLNQNLEPNHTYQLQWKVI
jgi:hypothetical protein